MRVEPPSAFASAAAARARSQCGRSASRQSRYPIPECEHLTGDRRHTRRERVAVAELEAIHPHGVRELVEQAFLRDRRLRHAEPAERARRWPVRVDGHGARAIRVIDVRTAGVHGHTVRHRRSPRCVRPGVELAGEVHRGEPAVARGADAGTEPRGVPFRGGHHRFGSRVREAHGPSQRPRRQREVRLHRQVELAPEAPADRRGLDPHRLLGQAQDRLELDPVHVRGLRRHLHLDPVADALRVPGLRLDVRVLDEAGLEDALDFDLRRRERLV